MTPPPEGQEVFQPFLQMHLKILYIGHSYHETTKSTDFFIDELKKLGDVFTIFEDCWKGELKRNYRPVIAEYDMVVVFQMSQVVRQLANSGHRNLIFVPMYDSAWKLDKAFWRSLVNVKILCFSLALRAICFSHRLDSFYIQYYPEGASESQTGYDEYSVFFWQRRTTPNWQTLISILPAHQFRKMHHHVALDPGVESPEEDEGIASGDSEIRDRCFGRSCWFEKKSDLVEKMKEFNLFFLPRWREGIGLSFLNAMELGLVPVGFDSATFNEYVINGINGFIVRKNDALILPDLHPVAMRMMDYMIAGRRNYLQKLPIQRDFLLKPVEPHKVAITMIGRVTHRFVANLKAPKIHRSRLRFDGESPLVSLVTIASGNSHDFARTYESVCRQNSGGFEYIVIDSHAGATTKEMIRKLEPSIDRTAREMSGDRGAAVRQAATIARGKYVLFMDSGNEFAENTALEEALRGTQLNAEIIYGHHYSVRKSESFRLCLIPALDSACRTLQNREISNPRLCQIPCESSILIARNLLLELTSSMRTDVIPHGLAYAAWQAGATGYHTNTVISKNYN